MRLTVNEASRQCPTIGTNTGTMTIPTPTSLTMTGPQTAVTLSGNLLKATENKAIHRTSEANQKTFVVTAKVLGCVEY
jgi:hypothetical protein